MQGATSVAVEIVLRVRCLPHTQMMLPDLDNNTRIAYGHLSIFWSVFLILKFLDFLKVVMFSLGNTLYNITKIFFQVFLQKIFYKIMKIHRDKIISEAFTI